MRRSVLAACIVIVVVAACGGRTTLGVGGSGDEGTGSSGGGSGTSGSGGPGASGSSGGSGGASGSSGGGVTGSSSGLPFDGGYPDFPDAYGSAPSTCSSGAPPQNGEACSDVGDTCFVPNFGDCRALDCTCEPPGIFSCHGINCFDGAVPFHDAGLVDGPATCPSSEPGVEPCFTPGAVCTYADSCTIECLCAGPEWVCAAQPPCSGQGQ
jgi:hypothetical protein